MLSVSPIQGRKKKKNKWEKYCFIWASFFFNILFFLWHFFFQIFFPFVSQGGSRSEEQIFVCSVQIFSFQVSFIIRCFFKLHKVLTYSTYFNIVRGWVFGCRTLGVLASLAFLFYWLLLLIPTLLFISCVTCAAYRHFRPGSVKVGIVVLGESWMCRITSPIHKDWESKEPAAFLVLTCLCQNLFFNSAQAFHLD